MWPAYKVSCVCVCIAIQVDNYTPFLLNFPLDELLAFLHPMIHYGMWQMGVMSS